VRVITCSGCGGFLSLGTGESQLLKRSVAVYCEPCQRALSLEYREQRAAWEADLKRQIEYDDRAAALDGEVEPWRD
jgi:hypothetical protein